MICAQGIGAPSSGIRSTRSTTHARARDVRHRHHRRRHQRLRHRPRCRRARPVGAAGEKGDLAGGTSSASTKLIHGGLRYLEHYEFRLVREALSEREVLLAMAPHIIRPLRFVLPHHRGLRPAWLIRLGLFLYDHLGGRAGPARRPARSTSRTRRPASRCRPGFTTRLRVFRLLGRRRAPGGAQRHGRGSARRRHPRAHRGRVGARHDGDWRIELRTRQRGNARRVAARALVNAAGPWVAEVIGRADRTRARRRCGSSRAATSWCRGCSTTTAPTSSRTPTDASSSPFPTSTTSR